MKRISQTVFCRQLSLKKVNFVKFGVKKANLATLESRGAECISRTPYTPIGGSTLSQGPKIQFSHNLAPKESLDTPN